MVHIDSSGAEKQPGRPKGIPGGGGGGTGKRAETKRKARDKQMRARQASVPGRSWYNLYFDLHGDSRGAGRGFSTLGRRGDDEADVARGNAVVAASIRSHSQVEGQEA